MKKRLLLFMLLPIIAITCGIVLTACGSNSKPNPEEHTHTWGEWSVTTAPTCTEDGVETRTCTDTAHTDTRPIEKLGHDWKDEIITTPATCTTDGEMSAECDRCGETNENIVIEKLGHDWNDWTQTTAPTCTEKGEEIRTCKRDNAHTGKRDINSLGHKFAAYIPDGNAACEEDGTKTATCENNGCSEIDVIADVGSKLGHDSGAWHTTKEPTCTEQGTKELRCTRCQTVLENDAIDPLDHDMQWINTTPATEIEDGLETYTCTRENCGHTTGATRTAYATGTPGLNYTAVMSFSQFSVSKGTVSDVNVIIPEYYYYGLGAKYLPVRVIDSSGFSNSNITSIVLPVNLDTIQNSAFNNVTTLQNVYYSGTETDWAKVTNDGNNGALTDATLYFYSVTEPTGSGYFWRWVDGVPTAWCTHDDMQLKTTPATDTTDGAGVYACTHENCPHVEETRILYATGTVGLSYALINGNTEYMVSRGAASSGDIFIPAYYRPNENSPYRPVTEMDSGIFRDRTIMSVTISANIKSIPDWAFQDCTFLTSVTFLEGSKIEAIGVDAFQRSGITSIVIPASVKTIDNYAFSYCESLKTVTFEEGSNLETIFQYAFSYSGLTNVTLPAGVKTVSAAAFRNCTKLVSIVIPEGVIFGNNVFMMCDNITTVFFGGADEDAWDKMALGSGNGNLTHARVTRYYYSETQPTTAGNFWRYVNGEPTAW